MAIQTIGFIGLGLIGGSLAKTIRRVKPEMTLIGYNRSKASLVAALEDGTLNMAQDSITDSFAACDMIFLCAPVEVNISCLKELSGIIRGDCILTDVGSVKTPIHEAVETLGLSGQFIGGHPMAGSERFGYMNAEDRLLENAYFILTPSGSAPDWMLSEYRSLVEDLDSLPVVLDYRQHDQVTAAISHLPHVIAYALVNLIKRSDSPEGTMRRLAAGGFKDITRIASSSPDMWQQICQENQEALLQILEDYQNSLSQMAEAIRSRDGKYLRDEFEEARVYRNTLPQNGRGSLPRSCVISVDILDEPGALSVVLSILGAHRISVDNLEIMNNRENQDGVLRLFLKDEEAVKRAIEALKRRNYNVYTE